MRSSLRKLVLCAGCTLLLAGPSAAPAQRVIDLGAGEDEPALRLEREAGEVVLAW
jgi:hypothetical protein